MNPSTVRTIFKPAIRSAARRTLVGRNRLSTESEQGGFTKGGADDLLQQTWQRYDWNAPRLLPLAVITAIFIFG